MCENKLLSELEEKDSSELEKKNPAQVVEVEEFITNVTLGKMNKCSVRVY